MPLTAIFFPFTINERLRPADLHSSRPGGVEELTVSGAALMSGILLHPQGDFGSDLYIAEKIEG